MMKKVCVVVYSRANYGRIKSFLNAVNDHEKLTLQLIVGASALLYRFGEVVKQIEADGFKVDVVVHTIVEGETPTTMAKSTGLGIIELATHFENLKPDFVLTVADRFETLSTAVAASYMNIPLIHTQGGEVTGSIDESVRHAITKLAHIHFPATKRAEKYLKRLGEREEYIFRVGCPSIDIIPKTDLNLYEGIFEKYAGVGHPVDINKKYILVLQHPVTTEYGEGIDQINYTLKAVRSFGERGYQIVWLWPNADAGSDDIAKGIRIFREQQDNRYIHFFKNFSVEDYLKVLNNCECIVGNSSSGLRESAYLGIPAVNIGSRQRDRERAANVIDVDYDTNQIEEAIKYQIEKRRYPSSDLVGTGDAGIKMAEIISTIKPDLNKRLNYLDEKK